MGESDWPRDKDRNNEVDFVIVESEIYEDVGDLCRIILQERENVGIGLLTMMRGHEGHRAITGDGNRESDMAEEFSG